jgi:hypothetical protein
MSNFYIIIFVLSVTGFTADVILRYMEKIKGFDFQRKLFSIKSDLIPIEKFFPETLTMLLLCAMVASATGFGLTLAGAIGLISLPCALASGMCVCFAVQHISEQIWNRLTKNRLPQGDSVAGLDGYCTDFIESGGWGKVKLFHREREYEVNAACADADLSSIDAGEKVIAVYESDGCYFVARADEINKGIDTRF